MNARHPQDALNSFSIKNIFYNKMDLRHFYFHVMICINRNKTSAKTVLLFHQEFRQSIFQQKTKTLPRNSENSVYSLQL